jgi:MerR family transcriptional regulator, light-induced transcriptional regulator
MVRAFLSPKDLAQAIGVSESTLKRWTDDGLLLASRTAGGHRRIAVAEALRFIRTSRVEVVRPDLLGFEGVESISAHGQSIRTDMSEQLSHALQDDSPAMARRLLLTAYLSGMNIASIFDGPVRAALATIGRLWQHGPEGIVIEHRATDTVAQFLQSIRWTFAPSRDDAPIAIGGTPEGDQHALPSIAAAAVCAENGLRDNNLGAGCPLVVLRSAIESYTPNLVWLAVGPTNDREEARTLTALVAQALLPSGGLLVVGGAGADRRIIPAMPNVTFATSMADLAAVARGVAINGHVGGAVEPGLGTLAG